VCGLPAERCRWIRRVARPCPRADARRRGGGVWPPAAGRSPARREGRPLHVRQPCCARGRLAMALCASRSARPAGMVRRSYAAGSRARGPRLHDRLMRKFFADRPTLRGFLIIALVALVVVVLNLYTALIAIGMLLRIAFFLAIAFFVYLFWRERREEI